MSSSGLLTRGHSGVRCDPMTRGRMFDVAAEGWTQRCFTGQRGLVWWLLLPPDSYNNINTTPPPSLLATGSALGLLCIDKREILDISTVIITHFYISHATHREKRGNYYFAFNLLYKERCIHLCYFVASAESDCDGWKNWNDEEMKCVTRCISVQLHTVFYPFFFLGDSWWH